MVEQPTAHNKLDNPFQFGFVRRESHGASATKHFREHRPKINADFDDECRGEKHHRCVHNHHDLRNIIGIDHRLTSRGFYPLAMDHDAKSETHDGKQLEVDEIEMFDEHVILL